MKAIPILLLILMVACSSYEMMQDNQRYVNFIEEINKPDDTAYDATLEWMAKNFVDSKEVIQIKDKETHHINATAIGGLDAGLGITLGFYYNLDIKIKNGKIKFDFTTNTIVDQSYYPQVRFVEDIKQDYTNIKDNIIAYVDNYSEDNF